MPRPDDAELDGAPPLDPRYAGRELPSLPYDALTLAALTLADLQARVRELGAENDILEAENVRLRSALAAIRDEPVPRRDPQRAGPSPAPLGAYIPLLEEYARAVRRQAVLALKGN